MNFLVVKYLKSFSVEMVLLSVRDAHFLSHVDSENKHVKNSKATFQHPRSLNTRQF